MLIPVAVGVVGGACQDVRQKFIQVTNICLFRWNIFHENKYFSFGKNIARILTTMMMMTLMTMTMIMTMTTRLKSVIRRLGWLGFSESWAALRPSSFSGTCTGIQTHKFPKTWFVNKFKYKSIKYYRKKDTCLPQVFTQKYTNDLCLVEKCPKYSNWAFSGRSTRPRNWQSSCTGRHKTNRGRTVKNHW